MKTRTALVAASSSKSMIQVDIRGQSCVAVQHGGNSADHHVADSGGVEGAKQRCVERHLDRRSCRDREKRAGDASA